MRPNPEIPTIHCYMLLCIIKIFSFSFGPFAGAVHPSLSFAFIFCHTRYIFYGRLVFNNMSYYNLAAGLNRPNCSNVKF